MSSRKRKAKGGKQGQGGGLKLKKGKEKAKQSDKTAPTVTPPHPTRPHHVSRPRLLLVSPVTPSQESPLHLTVTYDYHQSFDGDWEGPVKTMEELAGLFQFKDSPDHPQGRPLPPLLWHDLGCSPSLPPKKKPRNSSLGSRAAGFQRLERLASELQDCLSTEVTSQGTEVASQGTEGTSQVALPDCRTKLLLEEDETASLAEGKGESPQQQQASPQEISGALDDIDVLDVLFDCGGVCDGVEEGGCDGVEEGGCDGVEEGGCDGVEEGGCDGMEEGGCDGIEEGGCDGVEEGGSEKMEERGNRLGDSGDEGEFWSMAAEVVESSSWDSQQQGSKVTSQLGEEFVSKEADIFIDQLLSSGLESEGGSGELSGKPSVSHPAWQGVLSHSSPRGGSCVRHTLEQRVNLSGTGHMTNATNHMTSGQTHMKCDPRHMNRGSSQMTTGSSYKDRESGHMTSGLHHVTRGAGHMTSEPNHFNKVSAQMIRGPNHMDRCSHDMISVPHHMDRGSDHMTSGQNPMNRGLHHMHSAPEHKKTGPSHMTTRPPRPHGPPSPAQRSTHRHGTPDGKGKGCAPNGAGVPVGRGTVLQKMEAQLCCSQAEIALKKEQARLRRSLRLQARATSTGTGTNPSSGTSGTS